MTFYLPLALFYKFISDYGRALGAKCSVEVA